MHVPENSAEFRKNVNEAAAFVRSRLKTQPEVAMVLGSGLNTFAEHVENPLSIPYSEIPHMPQTAVAGHDGKLVVGQVSGREVLCFSGRVHAYEGYPLIVLTFATRLAAELDIKVLVATNAAGGAGEGMCNGCVMLITDFVNYTKNNPLAAIESDPALNPGYTQTDASKCFNPKLASLARDVASKSDIKFFEGTYMWCTGPSYETPLEVRSGRDLGCSAFGMSTVPEVLTAQATNMQVLAFSVVTNMAAGLSSEELNHAEVTQEARLLAPRFQKMIFEILRQLDISSLGVEHTRKIGDYTGPEVSAPFLTPTQAPPVREQFPSLATELRELLGADIPATAFILPPEYRASWTPESRKSLDSLSHIPATGIEGGIKDGVIALWGDNASWRRNTSYLVGVLAAAGVTRVISVVEGSVPATKSGHDGAVPPAPTSLSAVDDALDFAFRRPLVPYEAASPSKPADSAVQAAVECAKGGVYWAFEGPSFPSPAEQLMVGQMGGTFVGTTDVSMHLASRALGLSAQVIAVQGRDTAAANRALDVEFQRIAKVAAAPAPVGRDSGAGEQAEKKARADYTPSNLPFECPIIQSRPDVVSAAAADVKKGLTPEVAQSLESATIVIFQDPTAEEEFKAHLNDPKSFPYSSWEPVATIPGAIVVGTSKAEGATLIGVVGTIGLESGLPQSQATFPTRVARALGAKRAVLNVDLYSCSPDLAGGATVVIDDHTNLVGMNPLTGHNDAADGPRFPDMSKVYDVPASEHARKTNSWGSTKIGNISLPLLPSAALNKSVTALGASALSSAGVPEAILLRHSGASVVGIGSVVSTSEGVPVARANVIPAVTALAAWWK